jgi:transforming growth factor-beta-induced protein
MKKLGILLMVLAFAGFVACNDDDDLIGNFPETNGSNNTTNTDQTIAEVAGSTSQLSTFFEALVAANLVDPVTKSGNLSVSGNFTVFAPTNDAFEDFLVENGFTSLSDIPPDLLESVVFYHVVPARLVLSRGSTGSYASTLSKASTGNYLSLYLHEYSAMKVNFSAIDKELVSASNGLVYTIDKVLVPPSVFDFIAMNKSLSTLNDAVGLAASTSFDGSDGITVFAPINDAFKSKLDDLGLSSITDINSTDLSSALAAHVVYGYFLSSQLPANGIIKTLNPDKDIEVWTSGKDISLEDKDIDAITVDIQAINGVMHTIDGVIILSN